MGRMPQGDGRGPECNRIESLGTTMQKKEAQRIPQFGHPCDNSDAIPNEETDLTK